MPTRSHTFRTGHAYHIYDKNIDDWEMFVDKSCCEAFIGALQYYRFRTPELSYSRYKRLSAQEKYVIQKVFMNENHAMVNIECYTLMPNHYHLILFQKKENGILHFMSRVLNSITRYHNRRNDRKGPIFLPQFRSVEVHNRYQLMYLSKYIHRNPIRASLVQSYSELLSYEYSSILNYVANKKDKWIKTKRILSFFNSSSQQYQSYLKGE